MLGGSLARFPSARSIRYCLQFCDELFESPDMSVVPEPSFHKTPSTFHLIGIQPIVFQKPLNHPLRLLNRSIEGCSAKCRAEGFWKQHRHANSHCLKNHPPKGLNPLTVWIVDEDIQRAQILAWIFFIKIGNDPVSRQRT